MGAVGWVNHEFYPKQSERVGVEGFKPNPKC
jgi:hypothetical protein